MPKGCVLWRWDERLGCTILAVTPSEYRIPEKALVQAYSTHEYSGDRGFVSVGGSESQYGCFYSGPPEELYLQVAASPSENLASLARGVEDFMQVLLNNWGDDDLIQRLMDPLFARLETYPDLPEAEKATHMFGVSLEDLGDPLGSLDDALAAAADGSPSDAAPLDAPTSDAAANGGKPDDSEGRGSRPRGKPAPFEF